jgi:hypothetical protein
MKRIFLLSLLCLAALLLPAQTLTVRYRFANIEEGYDHTTRTTVFIDGEEAGTSASHPQSKPASLKVPVSKGLHQVRIVNYALYDGVWEEHTIANNYSIDCLAELELKVRKKSEIRLLFDLNSGTQVEGAK